MTSSPQHKYRIEAFEKMCAAQGVHGEAVALDSTYNRFCNDKGGRNTNKPGDLKVNPPSSQPDCQLSVFLNHKN